MNKKFAIEKELHEIVSHNKTANRYNQLFEEGLITTDECLEQILKAYKDAMLVYYEGKRQRELAIRINALHEAYDPYGYDDYSYNVSEDDLIWNTMNELRTSPESIKEMLSEIAQDEEYAQEANALLQAMG